MARSSKAAVGLVLLILAFNSVMSKIPVSEMWTTLNVIINPNAV